MGFFDKIKAALDAGTAPSGPAATAPPPVTPRQPQGFQATCDLGGFDFEGDPGAWWVAQRRCEQAWEEPERFQELLSTYGIRGEAHFRQLTQAFREYQQYVYETEGEQAWNELQQALVDASSLATTQEYRQAFDQADTGLMEPIEGVSLQDYGRIAARQAAGHDLQAILADFQMDPAKYARVSEAWNQRMAEDTTFTLTTEYGKAFMPAAQATVAMDGYAPPFTWEQVTEATVAMDKGTAAGLDPQAILASLGMTLNDYVVSSGHWGEWFNRNCMRDPGLHAQFTEMQARFEAKYDRARQDSDLSF